jgi:hypothetical protein
LVSKNKTKSTRGGARPRAGRKRMKPEDKMVSISFALHPELLERIDERRHQEEVGRSELLRRYAEDGLAKKPKLKKRKKGSAKCRKVPTP